MNMRDLKIIVTGGAQGMGQHFAWRLAEAGAHVAVGDIQEEKIAETIPKGGGRIVGRKLDVTSESDVATFVEWAYEQMKGLNGLINNAGILRDSLLIKRDRETGQVQLLAKEQWDAVLGVNLTGAMLMTRQVVKNMVERQTRPGVVVNMSSLARHGNRGQSSYAAAKSALATNTKIWALEFASFGIRVGAIAPGMIDTPMIAGMNPKAREALVGAIPVGRVGTPEDIWQAVRFVLECDYFNGRTIDIDGGLSM